MFDKISVVDALQTAIPFIEKFKGETFVLKLGGSAVKDPEILTSILSQVRALHILGMRIVIVHGGGEQATELSRRLGIETTMLGGRRVTDEGGLEAVMLTLNGKINTTILSTCRRIGLDAVGISGASSSIVTAQKRGPVDVSEGNTTSTVDFGHVGDIVEVNVETVQEILDHGKVPVISPLSADVNGNLLNINADRVAAAIGSGLKAEKLIFMSTPRGLMASLGDSTSLISLINIDELGKRIEAGEISDGMLPKVASATTAIAGGVKDVHFISYAMENSLLLEVLTSEGCGTKIVSENESEMPGVSK